MRGGRELSPLIQGTRYPNQMFRGGSLNLSGVVALGKAVEIAQDSLNFEMEDTRELRDFLEEEITRVDGVSALISWSSTRGLLHNSAGCALWMVWQGLKAMLYQLK